MKSCRLLLIFVACTAAAALARAEDSLIPIEHFVRDLTFDEIKVSPDGSKVAALSKWKEHLNLYVIDLKTKEPKMLTGLTTMSVGGVHWVGNNRLIFTGVKDGSLTGGLFAIDADGKNSRALNESAEQQGSRGSHVYRDVEIISRYGKSTDEILVASNERRLQEPDAYRMNVHTGKKRLVAMNPGKVRRWVADNAGAVRIGYGFYGGEHFLVARKGASGVFKEIKRWKFRDGRCEPLAFDQENRLVYVRSTLGRDTAAIALLDPETGEIVKELFHDDVYDAEDVVRHRSTGDLLGFAIEREKPGRVWAIDGMKKLQALTDEALPDTLNLFYSYSDDNRWIVVEAFSDRDPGTFYMLDTRELTLEKLVSRADWIKPEQMAAMKPVQFVTPDGLTIHGYLTLPPNSSGKNLPLIINPHGGPQARDEWRFWPEVQFLASRGYAVLRINFRGSIGYGRKFEQAGFGEWGRAMQDDITNAVKWAIAEGIADPKRVAIYGASYGGFATMAGLAFTPDLYCCGINYVGVTDMKLLLDTIPDGWEDSRAELNAMTGDPKKDLERMEAASPMRHVDNIRVPVFFAYGRLDERVDIDHGTEMAAKLRRKGIPVVWMEREDEGHGYRKNENQIAFYTEMEKFLATYLIPAGKVKLGDLKTIEMPALEK
ncbi:S9 family peptidase [Opitutus terrae]|uniref:Peptidase S9 prolyl oligopeptidase active site domain protein n=1 Tax=Opitutus terrae (strain DSM 11246 / JCM 15787 / PB90-1) TaxID=452637 RepID=B1ZUF2_OPITP|nr:S9 family peptidase [Opitutus terrae]ACB73995.1 peptidase S9 prolyl oligopeptidase active site domain protein [Opitutus terrae PB90-1]